MHCRLVALLHVNHGDLNKQAMATWASTKKLGQKFYIN